MRTIIKPTVAIVIIAFAILASVGCGGSSGTQGPAGPQGVSVANATINDFGHLVLTLSSGQTVDAGNAVNSQQPTGSTTSFTEIIPQIEPAIVRIDVTVRGGLDSGSGTIVDKRGYIITNEHVIASARSIKVTLSDNTSFDATVVASDSNQDIAIVKLNSNRTDFPVMTVGTMSDALVGASVITAGFPGGPDLPGPATYTAGIISALRTYSGSNYIQTDAPVNPGNSGGCLITVSGKMIGIPTEGISPSSGDFEDINLAIPIDQVSAYIAQNIK